MLKFHLCFKNNLCIAVGCLLIPGFTNGCGPGDKGVDSSAQGGGGFVPPGNGGSGANGGADSGNQTGVWPPSGYTNVTNTTIGAYALGPDISSGNVPANTGTGCSGLYGVVRDFKMGNQAGGHPDFETAPSQDVKGIVQNTLGPDDKPLYTTNGTPVGTSGAANFNQWYHDTPANGSTPAVNMSYIVALQLVTSNGISTFSASINNGGGLPDSSFFPLDGTGFGDQGQPHNFSFTTEIHTSFTYNGGETFTFKGDDDVWVFIDKKLAIDLGGRHAQETGSIQLNTLGLTVGAAYDLAVFHAERHTTQSNFRIDTTLAFTNCGQINGVTIN
jgi:fibro-slime domain-containing protein